MNHSIEHCMGVKGDSVCEWCHRKVAHEDLMRLVRQGKTATGEVYRYVNAEECESGGHVFYCLFGLWV